MSEVLIKTEGLCKSFIIGKTGVHVLKNLDIEIYKEDFTVIMGSSGSGKSTLLYSLSTMDNPTSGKVTLLGHDISKINEEEASKIRNKDISFIFQGINLLPDLTIYENITYAAFIDKKNKEKIQIIANEILKELGLYDDKEKYPAEISGGMQQRAAIGRAIINNPKVIFGDEPTGALNSSMGEKVLDILTDLNKKRQSIVMVTHDIKSALRGNRILYINDGKIDGELNLEKYSDEDVKMRKEKIKRFLEEKSW
ncbi:ABC transporter ATP-binding protein [Clostridium gasigenes]|uniref:Putative ABC transport system ATP-binding protein n=1 Tax=Clostridium gasigenes TaxID=94869 RepID=A0A1H0UJX5_9CLOT|nr:ABC transporter ATP-binding protein [Clostridium gasigenes]MBB6623178.1 ABC transporter ATP-binding protein [Clostridium gasigenes]MBU3087944.1 ABC transporter ATP-binding protein [Clostridium gasigenes]SDP66393.1 putative ABC transport system ATP-binding protein [Clostridium gasigenes]